MPYIGYCKLIKYSNFLILYDSQFTKTGWINRNNLLLNGKSHRFVLPVKKDSHALKISERELSPQFSREKLLKKIFFAYSNAPQFNSVKNIIEEVIMFKNNNLYAYISNSIEMICSYLEISAKIINSNAINQDPLKDPSDTVQDKVISLVKGVKGTIYTNGIGGFNLYSKEYFKKNGIDLYFIKSIPINYKQKNNNFISNLSVIDVIMFNEKEEIKNLLQSYQLL